MLIPSASANVIHSTQYNVAEYYVCEHNSSNGNGSNLMPNFNNLLKLHILMLGNQVYVCVRVHEWVCLLSV